MKIINKLGLEGKNKPFQILLCLTAILDGILNLFTIWFNYRINISYFLAAKHYMKQFSFLYEARKIMEQDGAAPPPSSQNKNE